jgi:hypothetical protein
MSSEWYKTQNLQLKTQNCPPQYLNLKPNYKFFFFNSFTAKSADRAENAI